MSDREAFEKWARDNGIRYQSKYSTGEYYFSDADLAWKAWQAAQAQAVNQQLLEALKTFVECWSDDSGFSNPYPEDVIKAKAAIEAAKETPPAAQVNQQLPAARVWNQAEGRDGKLYAHGWNDCLAAIAAAQEVGNE